MTSCVYEQSIHLRRPFSMPPDMIRGLFDSVCDTKEVENIVVPSTSNFCQRHDLPWATRPVLLLTMKQHVAIKVVILYENIFMKLSLSSVYWRWQLNFHGDARNCDLLSSTLYLSCAYTWLAYNLLYYLYMHTSLVLLSYNIILSYIILYDN